MSPRAVILATYTAAILAVPVSQAACDGLPDGTSAAPSPAVDIAEVVARSCAAMCPTAATCDLGGDKFCGAFAGIVADLGLQPEDEASLAAACSAEQPHCDLCLHAGVMCTIAGNPAAKCVAAETECNCLAVAAGAP